MNSIKNKKQVIGFSSKAIASWMCLAEEAAR